MRKILYDKDADALIVVVSDKELEYEEELDDLIVGFSKDNEPVWIEILDFRKGFLPEVINHKQNRRKWGPDKADSGLMRPDKCDLCGKLQKGKTEFVARVGGKVVVIKDVPAYISDLLPALQCGGSPMGNRLASVSRRGHCLRFVSLGWVRAALKVDDKPYYEPKSWFGVDLGVQNLVVVADNTGREILRHDGILLNRYKELLEKRRAERQRRRMKYFGNKKEKLGDKQRNFSRYINHVVAKEIVRKAKEYRACIVIEKLSGVKRKGAKKPKWVRKLLHRLSYHDLIQKIKYKAKLEGVPVIEVSPRNTSKTCSKCGFVYKRFKDQRLFHCPNCGLIIDRDLNAAINIARKSMEKYNERTFLPAFKAGLPARRRCEECGEAYFTPEISRKIDKIMREFYEGEIANASNCCGRD